VNSATWKALGYKKNWPCRNLSLPSSSSIEQCSDPELSRRPRLLYIDQATYLRLLLPNKSPFPPAKPSPIQHIMSSTSPGQGQWSGTWYGLPGEIQLLILRAPIHDGCPLSGLVTVCRQWQTVIERHIFSRIRLTPSRLANFDEMLQRNRVLVRYIWFCLELDEYDCSTCAPTSETIPDEQERQKAFEISGTDKCPITTAFRDLFSSLSTWNQHGGLALDISLYSPSDSEHWFKYLTFVPDTPSNLPVDCRAEQATSSRKYHDPEHGWVAGFRQSAPPIPAFDKVFYPVMENGRPFDDTRSELQWWDQLPSVPVVTCLLLRQQNRRRWKWDSLAHIIARLPRLRELHYEPWREWDSRQFITDCGKCFCVRLHSLKLHLAIFCLGAHILTTCTIFLGYLVFSRLFGSSTSTSKDSWSLRASINNTHVQCNNPRLRSWANAIPSESQPKMLARCSHSQAASVSMSQHLSS
jgi:hypothetical protein